MDMLRLDGWRISHRLSLILALVAVGFVIVTALLLLSLRSSLVEDHRNRVKHLSETAAGIVAHYHAMEQSGQLTREQAQEAAKEALRGVRYGNGDYFFIYDFQGNAVMVAAKPEMEGKNFLGKTDAVGTKLWDLFVEAGKMGGGFVEYWFPRAGGKKPLPKLSYLAASPEWKWVIGTGVYIDDVDAIFLRKLAQAAVVCGLGLALLLGVGFLVVRSILRQLGGEPGYAAEVMKRVAGGDLTVRVEANSKDSLLGSLNEMLGSLRHMVRSIAGSSQAMAEEIQRIASESERVAQNTKLQSDSTAAMAAAMEQLTVSINHISDNARETQKNSSHAVELANESEQRTLSRVVEIRQISTTVGSATDRIRQLVSRSEEIGATATVIKDISSQTNLLALNAAIEAARAGEQGRGFAVVADEVRALAERTSNATVQIETMIEAIQTDTSSAVSAMEAAVPQVERGVEFSETAANSLRSIREGSAHTLERIRSVADATQEQSQASNNLAAQVEHVAQMIERTCASTQQTSRAADKLQSYSQELSRSVAQFRY